MDRTIQTCRKLQKGTMSSEQSSGFSRMFIEAFHAYFGLSRVEEEFMSATKG